ncbi:MAG: U3 small nucleolar RNA-associated protein 13 [Alyxoria varia]|nr:MAG: U3 small nucleolar RNA-associated protein 13 [Alyxoria varia]
MAARNVTKTTFEPERVIEPIYTGGSVDLSQDGQILVTSLGEDAILTDLSNGQRLSRIEGDGETITTLCLTPSASHLILCSRSLSLRIFQIDRSEPEVLAVQLVRTLKPHSSPVVTSAVDQTGTLLATGGADGIVKVWDIRGGYTTHTLHGHGSIVSALCFFTASGQAQKGQSSYTLASGDESGKIRIWNLETRKTVSVLDSHVSVVKSIAYDGSSKMLLSASRDKTAILWEGATWKAKVTIPVLETIEAAGFISSAVIYTGGETGTMRFWNTSRGGELEVKKDHPGHGILQIIHYALSSTLLSVHEDQTLQLYGVESLSDPSPKQLNGDELIRDFPLMNRISGTHDEVIDFAFVGKNKNYLAVATNVEDIRILSLSESSQDTSEDASSTGTGYFGADAGLLQGHEDIVICLDVDWSGHWLVSGAKDNMARLWRLDPEHGSFLCYATFSGHAESLEAVAMPHGVPQSQSAAYSSPLDHPPPFFISGSQDKTIKRWDTATLSKDNSKAPRATYTRKAHDKDINAIDVNHNATLFASASQDRTVKIWSLEDGEGVGVLRGHRRGVWTVKFAPHNTPSVNVGDSQGSGARGLVITGSGDKTLKLWSLTDYSCLRTFEGHTNNVLKVVWMNPASQSNDTENNEQDRQRKLSKRGVQVASAAGDGLVKVWDVNSGELATTLDNHTDRVWALASHVSTGGLVSGGGDSVITFWKDTTSSTVAAAAAASTARVEQDQQLQNFIRGGSYQEAITLALQLNHPARLLALFTAVVGTYPPEEGSLCGVKAVDEVLSTLPDDQLFSLLVRIREWNANARTAPVAQKLLWTVLRSYSPKRLMNLKGSTRRDGDIREIFDALKAYTSRHYQRLEELIDDSYLVDFSQQEMNQSGVIGGAISNGIEA